MFQRKDLLLSIGSKFPESPSLIPINICTETSSKQGSVITFGFPNKLSDYIPINLEDKTVELYHDGQYLELSPKSLLKGFLKLKLDTTVETTAENAEESTATTEFDLEFMNFMNFRINELQKNQLPFDKSLTLSFDALLKSNGKNEKNRLMSCIKMIDRIKNGSVKKFFTPFLNVCQSSGSGKTKIATELMFEIPSFYVVFREEVIDKETSERVQGGYPHMSQVSKLFFNLPFQSKDDSISPSENPSKSTVGRYILLLKALLSDYIDNFRVSSKKPGNESFESVLKALFHEIMNGTFMGKELKLFLANSHSNWDNIFINKETYEFIAANGSKVVPLSMEIVIKACHAHLRVIFSLQNSEKSKNIDGNPFVLIVDEASLLSADPSPAGISRFRLFRRAINRLGHGPNFVVLTLGTNSDILDLNPSLTFDSFRFLPTSGELYPPFVLSRNWDLLLDYKELEQSPIGYHEMLKGRLVIFWFSLGRPLWSSISFSLLNDLISVKITNNSIESGEAYLAFWMVRVGLLVNPTNVITQHLVKSLMATLLHISPNLRSMRVHYPSEPALALGIRSILMSGDHLDRYYSTLEKFIKSRAIDTGRFSEIISGDICLLAIAQAKDKKMTCNWGYDEKLPKVCRASHFILETSDFHTKESQKIIDESNEAENQQQRDNRLCKDFEETYIIIEGETFVTGIYGDIMSEVNSFIPELIKTGLLNMTHYTQVSNKFPFESLKTESGDKFEATNPPLADPLYAKGNGLCNLITAEVLESMIIRGSGIMLAPCTFGLDHVIPICFKPDEISNSAENLENSQNFMDVDSAENAQDAIEFDTAESNEKAKDIAVYTSDNDENAIPVYSAVKPEYSFIGVQVKRGISENIRTIMAKGAVSNHYVRCGLHGAKGCASEGCKFRISDYCFKRLLENGFMLIHSLTDDEINISTEESNKPKSKHAKIEEENVEIICETSLPGSAVFFKDLQEIKTRKKEGKIPEDQYIKAKEAIENNLRNLVKDLCPAEFIGKIEEFKFDALKPSHYERTRFIPDLYFSFRISNELSVHCMVKRRQDGINEKLVAIYSKGLEAFSNVLPEQTRMTARRIIFDDYSIFDEITYDHSQEPPIKYTELVTGVVSRNNGSAIPVANNLIRSKYNLPLIPDNIPNYSTVTQRNIEKHL